MTASCFLYFIPLIDGIPSMASHTLHPVILCGGAGTRLWPLSREKYLYEQLLDTLGGQLEPLKQCAAADLDVDYVAENAFDGARYIEARFTGTTP